ncbi:hypothetical protein [Botrimarina mediterranea]|uniref:Uncharacterized protein n=1 Tax=Botrimarina mediterranea TaxID=2528022 RepID=A0A518K7W8_9BACT|nr:hypothetical protein [Botrimarina mediterranea]QDV73867.1 hypothetical protein Spa11_20660 [Botrimarina mediterranea]QDV78497.1 hypothetical protein K2D_21040 [Planctomycetes bacterium K2D]
MSNNSNSGSQSELDALLSELLDARDPSALDKLDALLRDNPGLQDEYIKYLSLHSLLNVEWNSLGAPLESLCESEASKLLPSFQGTGAGTHLRNRLSQSRRGRSRQDAETAVTALARKLLRLIWFPVRAPSPVAVAAVILGALGAAAMGGAIVAYSLDRVWWSRPDTDYTQEQIDAAERWLEAKRSEQGNLLGHFPATSAGLWTEVKPRITPANFHDGRLVPGEVDLQPFNGAAGKGYLVALPPGHGIELLVDVESVKENALIVKRVTADGALTGHSLSFNNHDVVTRPRSSWRVGRIGYWVDFNEYDQTRYYLLCGVSKGPNFADGGKWAYSDFKPLTVSRDLMFLGWDDGAIYGIPGAPDKVFEADSDFNDVSVILRLRRPEDIELSGKSQVVATPEREVRAIKAPMPADSYTLQVEPRQSILIQVSCPSGEPCRLDILCANRAERWWRYEESKGEEKFGLYSIDNRSDEPLDLSFIGRPLDGDQSTGSTDTGESAPLVHEVRASDADYCEIGYESPDVAASDERASYDKIRVRVHWIK